MFQPEIQGREQGEYLGITSSLVVTGTEQRMRCSGHRIWLQ